MKSRKLTFIFSILFSLPIFGVELSIESEPKESDIYVRELGSSNLKKIGTSPLKISLEEITGNFVSGNYFMLVIKKKNYQDYRLVMNSLNKSNMKLRARLDIIQKFDTFKEIDKYTVDIFEVQRLLRNKQVDSAIKKLDKMEEKFPYISSVPELLGSAYYLKKDLPQALGYYKKAFRLNPDNIDAYNMKELLEKQIVSRKGI